MDHLQRNGFNPNILFLLIFLCVLRVLRGMSYFYSLIIFL
jgi:hypothetical protein